MEHAQLQLQGKKGISGSAVKIIAVVCMLIDHIAAVILLRILLADGYVDLREEGLLYFVYQVMRSIGRLSFPIFCFMLVEGFQWTGNVRKYALRLAVFAAVSEIPFDLASCGRITWKYQNVFLTLFLGLFVLCAFVYFRKTVLPKVAGNLFLVTGALAPTVYYGMIVRFSFTGVPEERIWRIVAVFLFTTAVMAVYGRERGVQRLRVLCADISVLMFVMYLAEFLATDYGGMGVLTVAVMYALRRNRVVAMAAGCIVLTVMNSNELPAFLALFPVMCYNGKKDLKQKYFFYVFYPLHFLILYLITVWMGYGSVMPR